MICADTTARDVNCQMICADNTAGHVNCEMICADTTAGHVNCQMIYADTTARDVNCQMIRADNTAGHVNCQILPWNFHLTLFWCIQISRLHSMPLTHCSPKHKGDSWFIRAKLIWKRAAT